jgi:hypothetical protein
VPGRRTDAPPPSDTSCKDGEIVNGVARWYRVNLTAALEFAGRLLARRDVETWERFVEVCENSH